MSLRTTLSDDLTAAMKEQREPDRTVLRSLTAAIKNADIAEGKELDDAGVTKLLSKQLKQREESVEAYKTRPELAKQERAEADFIRKYLPEPLGEAELTKLVEEAITQTGAAGPSDMGKVMGAIQPKIAGRADGGTVAALVKEKLGADA